MSNMRNTRRRVLGLGGVIVGAVVATAPGCGGDTGSTGTGSGTGTGSTSATGTRVGTPGTGVGTPGTGAVGTTPGTGAVGTTTTGTPATRVP